jgi:hypothetical protein
MAHQTEPDPELIQRIRWYISLRWFLLLTILLPGLTALYLGSGYTPYLTSSAILGAVALATNLIFYILAHVRRNRSYLSRLGISLLIFDTLFITYFIYANGGIESRSQLLYALPILISAALFGRLAVYLTAACSALTYDMVIAGNYWGFLHSPQMVTHQASDFS